MNEIHEECKVPPAVSRTGDPLLTLALTILLFYYNMSGQKVCGAVRSGPTIYNMTNVQHNRPEFLRCDAVRFVMVCRTLFLFSVSWSPLCLASTDEVPPAPTWTPPSSGPPSSHRHSACRPLHSMLAATRGGLDARSCALEDARIFRRCRQQRS